jgi:DNA polymerase-4
VKRHPATLSRELTLQSGSEGGSQGHSNEIIESLSQLAASLDRALRRDGLQARRIALRMTTVDDRTLTRSRSLDSPLSGTAELIVVAGDLLARANLRDVALRRVGLVLKGLEVSGAEDRQLDLF